MISRDNVRKVIIFLMRLLRVVLLFGNIADFLEKYL